MTTADVCKIPRGTEQSGAEGRDSPKGQGQVDTTVPKTSTQGGSGAATPMANVTSQRQDSSGPSGHDKRSYGGATEPRVSGQGARAAQPSQIKQRQRLKKARLSHDQGVQVRWEVPREPERRGAGRRDCPKTKRQGRDNPVPMYERTKVDKDSNPSAGCLKALPLQG